MNHWDLFISMKVNTTTIIQKLSFYSILFNGLLFKIDAELILSSSYLTYQHWKGYIGLLTPDETDELIKSVKPLNLRDLSSGKSVDSGINQARWISNERFVIGTDNGEVMLYKLNNQKSVFYELSMVKQEHDSMVLCVATNFNSEIALSGSDDSKIKVWDLNEEMSIKTLKGSFQVSKQITI